MIDLKQFKQGLKKQKVKGLALDIDETLSFTAEYWVSELSRNFGNPEGLTARQIFQKYRLIQDYPHWKTKKAINWMRQARSSNEVQKNIPIIENSNHAVNKINKIIPIVCYLTVRPEGVVEGTSHWLEKHNFPKAQIIAKPNNVVYEDGTKWKAKALQELYPHVLGIVDDNPSLIQQLPNDYKGYIFLYDFPDFVSDLKNVFVCPTWDEVLKKVSEVF